MLKFPPSTPLGCGTFTLPQVTWCTECLIYRSSEAAGAKISNV